MPLRIHLIVDNRNQVNMIDFDKINRSALNFAQSLVQKWIPGGIFRGREYVVKNPNRADNEAGSFSINCDSGIWKDFASGDGGSDLISLYSYINNLTNQGDAAKAVADQINLKEYQTNNKSEKKTKPSTAKKTPWKPIFPVPDNAPEPPSTFTRTEESAGSKKTVRYKLTHVWEYKNETGALLGYVTRFEGPTGKETPPMTFCSGSSGKQEWRFLSFPDPRPLFNLTRLHQAPKQKVIIVEGEKCAKALQDLYDEFAIPITVTTWPGGGKAVKKANWQLLKGREVCIWPDADKQKYPPGHELAGEIKPVDEQPGYVTAVEIAQILKPISSKVKFIRPPEDKPPTWDVYDAIHTDKWTLQQVQAFIKKNLTAPPDPKKFNRLDSAPFQCLGYDGDYHYYLPSGTSQVKAIKGESHNAGTLLTMAPLDWWHKMFPGEDGKVSWYKAADFVMRANEKQGVYDPDRLRGRGAWWDTNRVVVHMGDRLLVDSKEQSIASNKSCFIYEAGLRINDDISKPLPLVEAKKFIELIDAINFENPLYNYFLAGWCVLAPICGAITWRPHIWLTGQRGTGKSYIISRIIKPAIGPFGYLYTAPSSAAGIRQELVNDALSVIYDESEAHETAGQRRMEEVFELLRQASMQTEAKIAKGTKNQTGKKFEIRSMFCLSSIGINITKSADESRITVLPIVRLAESLREPHFIELNNQITKLLTPQYCSMLRARTISMIPTIRQNIVIFTTVIAEMFGERRIGDQLGTLLAGMYALYEDTIVDIQSVREWIKTFNWDELNQSQSSDERNLLDLILQYQIKVSPTTEISIDEMLEEIAQKPPTPGFTFETTYTTEQMTYIAILKRHGIRMDKIDEKSDKYIVWISDSHSAIRKMLEKSPWPNTWARLLKRLPGAISKSSVRFTGSSTRATGIPYRVALGE